MNSIAAPSYPEQEQARALPSPALAAQYLEQAYSDRSKPAPVWLDLGLLYQELGDREKAVNAFCRVIELDPEGEGQARLSALEEADAAARAAANAQPQALGPQDIVERGKLIQARLADVERFFRLSVVYLDITNFCNYRCAHCGFAAHRWTDERDIRKYMPFEEARGYIHKVERGLRIMEQAYGIRYDRRRIIIHPQGGGEPLIHPNFHAIIREITRFGYSTRLTTNGSMLHGERAQALLDANLNELHISIDAASEETYAAIRQKGMYNRVVRNVENFIVQCRRMRPKPHITVSLCHSPFNRNDWKAFCEYWAPRADDVWIQRYMPVHGETRAEHEGKYTGPRVFCSRLPGCFSVNSGGDTIGCQCGFVQAGNLGAQNFEDMFLSLERIRTFECHEQGRFDEVDACRDCARWIDKIPLEDEKLIAIKGRAYRLKRTHEDVRIYNSIGQRVVDLNDPSFLPPLREDEP